MSIHSSTTPNKDVVDNDRPRTRPRGRGGVGRPYYVRADHPLPPALASEGYRPDEPTTFDPDSASDAEPQPALLEWFEDERERCAGQRGVPF